MRTQAMMLTPRVPWNNLTSAAAAVNLSLPLLRGITKFCHESRYDTDNALNMQIYARSVCLLPQALKYTGIRIDNV